MFRNFSCLVFSALFFVGSVSPALASGEGHGEEEEFDIAGMIMHHIGDDHGYEITHGVKVPLPVILYSKEDGLQIFSSSKIDDGQVYNGYKSEHGHIVKVNEDGSVNESIHPLDLSITRNVATMLLSATLLVLIFTAVAKGYSTNKGKAPKGIQSLLEPIIVFLRDDVVKPAIGHNYGKYFPYLLTLFFFILINNILGLFPAGPNLTGNIAVTMVLAVITFLIVNISANKYYWKHVFMPDTPVWMYVIMIPVELVGVIMKPMSLMIRLFANITAGHIIMLSLYGLIFIFKSHLIGGAVGGFALFMSLIELLVAFVQALIFTLLTSMYIGSAVEDHH
ncbi:MAG: F0F1 ATP synthase subunit A [Leadbetterella sp.]|nr:F0F1 ATP synthase subunit A [Leadbetterella sp.]